MERSRRKFTYDYNKYVFAYDSLFSSIPMEIIIETSFYQSVYPIVLNVKLFKVILVKLIGDIFDCYDSIINLFGGQCQTIW